MRSRWTIALGAVAAIVIAIPTAYAGGWHHGGWYHGYRGGWHQHWRGPSFGIVVAPPVYAAPPPVVYAPPPVVYAPPPVVYAPPPVVYAPPLFSFGIRIH